MTKTGKIPAKRPRGQPLSQFENLATPRDIVSPGSMPRSVGISYNPDQKPRGEKGGSPAKPRILIIGAVCPTQVYSSFKVPNKGRGSRDETLLSASQADARRQKYIRIFCPPSISSYRAFSFAVSSLGEATVRTRINDPCARTLELPLLVRPSVFFFFCGGADFWCVFRPLFQRRKFRTT